MSLPADVEAVHRAHEAYVEAININDAAKDLAAMTDDIVYRLPHEPQINGKAEVSKWIDG